MTENEFREDLIGNDENGPLGINTILNMPLAPGSKREPLDDPNDECLMRLEERAVGSGWLRDDEMAALINKARAELAELQADRARLEWLVDCDAGYRIPWKGSDHKWNMQTWNENEHHYEDWKGYDTFRAAIDDAIKEAPDA